MGRPEFSVCLFAYANFCGTEFAQDLDTEAEDSALTPDAGEIHLVLNNDGTHKTRG